MEYSCGLRDRYWWAVHSWKKRVEGRINAGKFAEIKPGDILCFRRESDNAELRRKVVGLRYYASFAEMVSSIGREALIPGTKSDAEAVELYESIPTYKERSAEHGVVAIILSE